MRLLRAGACCIVLLMLEVPSVGHHFSDASRGGTTEVVSSAVLEAAQPKPSPDEFVPVTDVPESEQIPAIRLVATAYGFIWVVLLGYVWTVGKRLRTVEAELDQLQRKGQ